jgi:hypothetical protein
MSATTVTPRADRVDELAEGVLALASVVRDLEPVTAIGEQLLGHDLHPMLTDLPIGFWTAAFTLDLVGGRASRPAAQRLVGLGVLSVAPTVWSGLHDAGVPDRVGDGRLIAQHASCNVAATVLYAGSWAARRRGHWAFGVALGMLGATAATVGGLLGGRLAFGSAESEAGAEDSPTDRSAPAVPGSPDPVEEHWIVDLTEPVLRER